MGDTLAPGAPPKRSPHFLINVLWSWLGVAVSLSVGLLLNPYIVRKLGEERYGIWALVFALLDYLWFFDLGFNTAVTNFCARFQARSESRKINEVVNTALAYFGVVAVILMSLALLASMNVARLFPSVRPEFQRDFALLVRITGVSWGGFVMLHIFTSCLDGFQRFDLTTRAWVSTLLLRSVGWVVLLASGYGLVEMGILAAVAQFIGYSMNVWNFRRVFPEMRLAPEFVRAGMIREMVRYGVPSFLANSSNLLLNQSAPVMIGRFRSMADVGFFTLPMRLLQNAVEAVSRVGLITRSTTAEREASGRKETVLHLGVYSNRYCFTLFTPLVLYLVIYGPELIRIWITPSYAESSAPLLPVLAPAIAIALAGQFNSSAILFGLATHQRYAYALMVEATLNVAGLWLAIPRFGILGAAWVSASLMVLVRGLYTPWLVCQSLEASFAGYMRDIYLRPFATALPVWAIAAAVKWRWLPGRNWTEVIAGGALVAGLYLGLAFWTCFEPEHRRMLTEWVKRRLAR
ncbi:MAG: oligosaccharide flippase family protein [Bryobacteraceae bacterium]